MSKLVVFNHPLMDHKLALIRDEKTGTKDFRQTVSEIGMLMAYEITRDLPQKEIEVKTPVSIAKCKTLAKEVVIIPILRAGLGMVDGITALIPTAKVGHIGLYRDPATLMSVEYYCKLPADIDKRLIVVVDPMLATGGSAIDAISQIKGYGGKSIKFLCIIAAPEGIKALSEAHPDVEIFCANVDEKLNEKGYIVPGLGDAGDRIFGTK